MRNASMRKWNMKAKLSALAAVLLLIGFWAWNPGAAAPAPAVVTVRPGEMKFELLATELPNGPKVLTLWGDRAKGQHGTIVKLPPGMVSPPHTHSADSHGVVLQGTVKHFPPSQSEAAAPELPAGSYFMIPAGLKHISTCVPHTECIQLVFQKGVFDTIMADDTAKPKGRP